MAVLRLIAQDNGRTLREFPLGAGTVTVGRSSENAIVLSHPSVSRAHARITPTREGYRITDLGSANGVFLDNLRVGEGVVAPGSLFRIGECWLQIVDEPPTLFTAPPAAGPRWGLWISGAALVLVAGGGCALGAALYLARDAWRPLLGEAPPAAAPPIAAAAAALPFQPPADCTERTVLSRACAWTMPGSPTGSCFPGFCFDGGPGGSGDCKQLAAPESSSRDERMDVACDDGFREIRDRCTNAVTRCDPD
jgi:hypothetical protein